MTSKIVPQLTTDLENFDSKNITFSEPKSYELKNDKQGPSISYKRIYINTKYDDGTQGPLIVQTPRLFTFGVQENKNKEGEITGHQMCLNLWKQEKIESDGPKKEFKSNPTNEERIFTDFIDKLVMLCLHHLHDLKKNKKVKLPHSIEPKMNSRDFKEVCPVYWKYDDDDNRDTVKGPQLYAKLWEYWKDRKINSMFFDVDGKEINPLDILNEKGFAECALKIESIYIGAKISLQIKIWECTFESSSTGEVKKTSLLKRGKAKDRIINSSKKIENLADLGDDSDNGNESDKSIIDSDDEDEKPPTPKKKPRKVKKAKK